MSDLNEQLIRKAKLEADLLEVRLVREKLEIAREFNGVHLQGDRSENLTVILETPPASSH